RRRSSRYGSACCSTRTPAAPSARPRARTGFQGPCRRSARQPAGSGRSASPAGASARPRPLSGAAGTPVRPAVREVVLVEPLVRAEEEVLGHVGGIAARRRAPPESLGQAAHVMRAGAAADAEIPHAEGVRVLPELGDLVAVAGEGVEGRRERPVVRNDLAARV